MLYNNDIKFQGTYDLIPTEVGNRDNRSRREVLDRIRREKIPSNGDLEDCSRKAAAE